MWASLPWAGGTWGEGLGGEATTAVASANLVLTGTPPGVFQSNFSYMFPAAAQLTLSSSAFDIRIRAVYFADLERLASRSGDVTLRQRSGTPVVRSRSGVATVDG